MLKVVKEYSIHTGNLFGVAMGWPKSFCDAAQEEAREEEFKELDYTINPAFAGAWCTVWSEELAEKIRKRWNQLLPLAIHSAHYEKYKQELIEEHLT